jgi:hypothetical protein
MATKYTWPTDPPGKPPSHSISWQQHWEDQGRTGPAKGLPSSTVQYGSTPSLPAPDGSNGGAAAAAANLPAPQPPDPNLELQKLQGGFTQSLATGEANYQRGQAAYNYGYNADGSVNTANPYNQANLLQRNYQISKLGTMNGLAAQGQLYSGAMANAQGANDFNYSSASNALQNQAQNAYHTIGFNQLSSIGQNVAGLSADQLQSLLRSVYPGS